MQGCREGAPSAPFTTDKRYYTGILCSDELTSPLTKLIPRQSLCTFTEFLRLTSSPKETVTQGFGNMKRARVRNEDRQQRAASSSFSLRSSFRLYATSLARCVFVSLDEDVMLSNFTCVYPRFILSPYFCFHLVLHTFGNVPTQYLLFRL